MHTKCWCVFGAKLNHRQSLPAPSLAERYWLDASVDIVLCFEVSFCASCIFFITKDWTLFHGRVTQHEHAESTQNLLFKTIAHQPGTSPVWAGG